MRNQPYEYTKDLPNISRGEALTRLAEARAAARLHAVQRDTYQHQLEDEQSKHRETGALCDKVIGEKMRRESYWLFRLARRYADWRIRRSAR